MEILPDDSSDESRPSSGFVTQSSRASSASQTPRPTSSHSRRAPPINKQDRPFRTPTPTKNVRLEAVKRKVEHEGVAAGDSAMAGPVQTVAGAHIRGDSTPDTGSDAETEPIPAPNELLLEFLECVMNKQYVTAHKLCKMILIYEPTNAQALQFQPLLETKIQQEEEAAQQGSGSEASDSSDEEGEEDGPTDDEGVDLDNEDSSTASESEDSSDND